MSNPTLKELALWIATGTFNAMAFTSTCWEFRKGKNFNDINAAIRKCRKNGRGKFEYELDFLELYLGDILKKKRRVA